MCMTLAVANLTPQVGTTIIAADRRHAIQLTTGERVTEDYGGKLFRLGTGWVAGTGDSLYLSVLLELLRDADAGETLRLVDRVLRQSDDLPRRVAERWPGYPTTTTAVLVIANRGCVGVIAPASRKANMGPVGADRHRCIVTHPVGFTNRRPLRTASARTRWDLVRLAAVEFAEIAVLSEAVSPTIEVGIGDDYLTGRADDIAVATDAQLREMLDSPPAPDFDAFTRILERVTV